jgi:hypothetical protein
MVNAIAKFRNLGPLSVSLIGKCKLAGGEHTIITGKEKAPALGQMLFFRNDLPLNLT